MSRQTGIFLASAIAVVLAASSAHAQYDLSWFTVDGGGAMSSTGGTFTLAGTIGQPDASSFSPPMTGGTFELVGGFWAVAAPVCTCPGDLNGDSLKNGRDVQQFTACVISGGACGCADMDGAGGITATDVNLFVTDLLSGATCP
jgi:hypothetical protein